ncbi:MAG: hypothetical protein AAGN46_16725, partial [Acidobacteriota bacterium]
MTHDAPDNYKLGTWTVCCPDCGTALDVDATTGQVVGRKAAKKPPAEGQSFDALLADIDASKERAGQVFDQEMRGMKDRDRVLEEKFRRALERA